MLEDAGIYFTRPTGRSFALLKIPGLSGVRGYLENHEAGRTNAAGELILTDLIPYYANRIGIEHKDVPFEYELKETERFVAPPFRGGALVIFSARATNFVRGVIAVLEGGLKRVPAYGELRVQGPDGEVASPLGGNGEFELDGLAPGRYRAVVSDEHGVCSFDLHVPASTALVIELGEVRCIR